MPKRQWTAEQKMQIVLAGLLPEAKVVAISACKNGVWRPVSGFFPHCWQTRYGRNGSSVR